MFAFLYAHMCRRAPSWCSRRLWKENWRQTSSSLRAPRFQNHFTLLSVFTINKWINENLVSKHEWKYRCFFFSRLRFVSWQLSAIICRSSWGQRWSSSKEPATPYSNAYTVCSRTETLPRSTRSLICFSTTHEVQYNSSTDERKVSSNSSYLLEILVTRGLHRLCSLESIDKWGCD